MEVSEESRRGRFRDSDARPVRIGLVGVGSFGGSFVRLFRDHPLVERLALCDVDGERLGRAARKFDIAETYDNLDALCRVDNLDAVALFTQPWLHAPQAIQVLESGKHVYSAVPIISLDDGDEMLEWCSRLIDACRRTGCHYMMGETSYYRPQAVYCRQRAARGDFGRFVLAEGEYFHDIDDPGCSLRDVARRRWGDSWKPEKRGGVPFHYPTHSIGGLLSVINALDPDAHLSEVSAIGHAYPGDDWFATDTESGNTFANETALFRCSNGAAVRICEYRRIGHTGREAFSLFGTQAGFREGVNGTPCHWVTKEGTTELTTDAMREPLPSEILDAYRRGASVSDAESGDSGIYGGHGGSHAYLVNEFVQAVARGRRPVLHAWAAARYFVPGIIAHQSALRGGELLKIPDLGLPPSE